MNRLSLFLAVLAVASLSSSGCSLTGSSESSSEKVSFTTDQTEYAVGETATLTIANESDQTIAFNLSCSLIEERKRVEGWRPIRLKKTCQAYEKMAAPGQESRYQFAIPDTLRQQDARSYRFGTEVTIGERDTLLTTNEFELKGRTKEE